MVAGPSSRLLPASRGSRGRRRDRSGQAFTLVELLFVMAVLAVLGSLVLGAGRYAREKGRVSRATGELVALQAALETYRLANGDYPRTDDPTQLLQSLLGRRGPGGEPTAAHPVIEIGRFNSSAMGDPLSDGAAVLWDPWGAPYRYAYKSAVPWTNPAFVLFSAGPDGVGSLALLSGGFPNPAASGSGDNIWSSPP